MPQEWIEVNIMPLPSMPREILLVETIDTLVHDTFADSLRTWFFGWYSAPEDRHLRLSMRWHEIERSDDSCAELFDFLNSAQRDGKLARWWQGKSGVRGEIYNGEEDTYGDLWELYAKSWHDSSELALALIKLEPGNQLAEARQRHWDGLAHGHANRLGWGHYIEAFISLNYARFYLTESAKANQELTGLAVPIVATIANLLDKLAAGPSASR